MDLREPKGWVTSSSDPILHSGQQSLEMAQKRKAGRLFQAARLMRLVFPGNPAVHPQADPWLSVTALRPFWLLLVLMFERISTYLMEYQGV
jgi:hypothetical protein